MSLLFLIVVLAALIACLPRWSFSRDWGYGPSGVLGLVLLILLIGGRRIARNRGDRQKVRGTVGVMAACVAAVLLLTVIWMR